MDQEGEQAPDETQESSARQLETSNAPDFTSTPVVQDDSPAEQPNPEAHTEPSVSVTPTTSTSSTNTAPTPQPQVVLQPGEPQPVNPDSQSRVFPLPDSYRGIGVDLCAGYGSLSRATLHNYWPTKNFQAGAHYTLPFLRDSYAAAGLSSQTDEDTLREQSENPQDMKTDHPATSYATLGGGLHQFRPITTMELLREPSRTR